MILIKKKRYTHGVSRLDLRLLPEHTQRDRYYTLGHGCERGNQLNLMLLIGMEDICLCTIKTIC